MASDDNYWLNEWASEYEITSPGQIEGLFKFPGPMSRLVELAEASPKYSHSVHPVDSLAVTAGTGMDLSNQMSCICSNCWYKQTESWGGIFHYFDRIVVAGMSPNLFLNDLHSLPEEGHSELQRVVSNHVAVLLNLKNMGIEKYLIFRDKPTTLCPNCANRIAGQSGLSSYRDQDLMDRVATRLADEAEVKTRFANGVWRYWVYHPFFSEYSAGSVAGVADQPPPREEIAKVIVRSYAGSSIMDIMHASNLKTPLIKGIETSWIGPEDKGSSGGPQFNDVVLNMRLPVMDGIPISDLLKLREDESESFEAFRKGIREAIRVQISQSDSESPRIIANSVVEEYVKPTLADIEHRLKINKRKLSSKTAASVAVGSVATSAGLMLSIPLVVATGVAAAAASLTHVYKYFDDAGSIELSDMYFLWKLKSSAKN